MTDVNGRIVTMFGSSRPVRGDALYETAYELGRALGAAGYTICNGGYGGIMEASARGAKEASASTIGVTCKAFSRSGPNPYIDRVIEADDLFDRLRKLIDPACAFVILPGGSGTLVELALVWELIAKRSIRRRPIVLYGRFWKSVIETTSIERPKSVDLIHFADTPEQVVQFVDRSAAP